MKMNHDQFWMRKAIALSRRYAGKTHPNPAVGCVIVQDNEAIGQGFHHGPGTAHAEVEAIRSCPVQRLTGSTCYVTLEPCNHQGRTPPCTDALIAAGISRVVIAVTDPNPGVPGGGVKKLLQAGLTVDVGVLAEEAREVILPWLVWITTGKPFVLLKMAMSLDGRVATHTGESRWISGELSRRKVHLIRQRFAGIMVGAGTIIHDNPRLTARKNDLNIAAPTRVIIDPNAESPRNSMVFDPALPGKTLWIVSEKTAKTIDRKTSVNVTLIFCPENNSGLDFDYLMHYLGSVIGLESILLEGGPTLAFSMIQHNCVDKVMLFIAPKLIGGVRAPSVLGGQGFPTLQSVPRLHAMKVRKIGEDVLIEGFLGNRVCLQESSGKSE